MDTVAWPTPQFIRVNGIRMALHAAGPQSDRPPLVFVHGWPELAYSWRHQVAALSAAGWRCLAPDMRGYGQSDCPDDVEAYDLPSLCGDLVGLLDHAGVEDAVFVGHDWGGLVVWEMARRHPECVRGVISVCTPHRARLPFEPMEGMRKRFGEDFYIVYFQDEGPAEELFEADLDRTFRLLQRSGPQGQSNARSGASVLTMPEPFRSLPTPGDDATLLSAAERAVYVSAFAQSGFRGGLNWYRNFTRNWRLNAALPDAVHQPCLMILAELDEALPPSAAKDMGSLIADLRTVEIGGAGHSVMQEDPHAVNTAMLSWLAARFG